MRRRGFTLVEVLIAVGLVAALLGSMFAFLFDMLSTRDRALDAIARRLAAATLVERLEADVMTCLVGDDVTGAGISGDATHLVIAARGVSAHLAERGLGDPAVLGDLAVTEYRFDEASGVIEARRLPAGEAPRGDQGFEPLGPAWKVRFRYRDASGWQDSFDSLAAGTLPAAVEVAVWFRPWPGQAEIGTAAGAAAPDDQPLRLTFDATAGFDEAEYARRSDQDLVQEPRPDRFRVIEVPDGSADDPYADTDLDQETAGAEAPSA